MANLITQWLNPNNFAVLRDKFNAVVTKLSGGIENDILVKSGTGNGDFTFKSIMDVMPVGQPWETFVTDLSLTPFNGKWIQMDGKTISSTGGSGDYTNLDYKPLFLFLWNNFTNDACPVSGGRGTSAEDDYNDDKFITLPDVRGRFNVGNDSRTTDPSNDIWDADYSVMGNTGGLKDVTLITNQIPSHSHNARRNTSNAGDGTLAFSLASIVSKDTTTEELGDVIRPTGGGLSHENRPPYFVINKIIKAKA